MAQLSHFLSVPIASSWGGQPPAWALCSDTFLLAPATLSDWICYCFTFFWCSPNFLACRAFIFPHLSVIHIRGKRAVVVVDCRPRLLVSKRVPSVKENKSCASLAGQQNGWAEQFSLGLWLATSPSHTIIHREEKLPLHIFVHINQAWGLGLERLNSCSVFPAKMPQSTGDKINSFLLSESPKLFINKEKKVPDLSPSRLVCVGMWRVLILLLTLHSPFPGDILYKSALESSGFWNQVWQNRL